jgi:D-ribose pyranose/furanose isomerase RbsD
MKKMVTTDLIIHAMNSVVNEMKIEELQEAEEVATQQPAETEELGIEVSAEVQEVPAENPGKSNR